MSFPRLVLGKSLFPSYERSPQPGNEQTRQHVSQKENGQTFATSVDFSNLLPKMSTDPQFRAARALLNRTTAPLATGSGPIGTPIVCVDQTHGAPSIKANNLVKLQRTVEAAAMVPIDRDTAIGAGVRRRQP